MECRRCGNKDPTYFYKGSKGFYCRKCISFNRQLLEDELQPMDYSIIPDASQFHFDYPLTKYQKKASSDCLKALNSSDVLLACVCGAGKTEITVESIASYLSKGLKVCYAISRREVVIELAYRFSKFFPNARVVSVYGGHHNVIEGDLIVCTTHQLYRYYQTFDLLILDEVDAFPLKGNDTLMNISFKSCKGRIIFSTATVDKHLRGILENRKYSEVNLYVRPSLKPLIVPKIIYINTLGVLICLAYLMHKMTNQCIIFVSSKKECVWYYKLFSRFYSCSYVYAELEQRNQNIIDFKNKKFQFIFATTVLERGITIKDVNVIILDLNANIFDTSSLVQMLGRVGRNFKNPYGEAYILSNHFDRSIIESVRYLKEANSYL